MIAIIMIVGIFSFSGLVAWYAISNPDVRIGNTENLSEDSNLETKTVVNSDFETKKQFVLDNLAQLEQDFTVQFDKDLTSKQENDAIFHTYKIIHKTDGWIGDLTFYYGKPTSGFHPSKFDNVFQTNVFLSTENGIKPTTHSLSVVKNILFVLIPVWTYADFGENESGWIDNVIKNSPVNENGERSETISLDKKEIRFDYKQKELGYYQLIITDKIN
jgi:hypothetical protein